MLAFRPWLRLIVILFALVASVAGAAENSPRKVNEDEVKFSANINVIVPSITSDKGVNYNYDIAYIRAPRAGDQVHKRFYTDIATPVTLEPGADLMLLHPSGSEELLVAGGEGAITDPYVSFDGQWIYYTHIYSLKEAGAYQPPRQGADIFKIHVKSRKIVRLTNQVFTPNTGAADWSSDMRKSEKGQTHLSYGVLNFGCCPLPGKRIVYTSNRNAFRPPHGYPRIALQLFVAPDRDENIGETETADIEQMGHLNIAGALHPVVLTDGRIMFSSLESQGIRDSILWGIWTIHPDGTNWNPLVSAFDPGSAPNAFHFQTQLSDGSPVVEEYYNQNNSGFGAFIKLPATPAKDYPAFSPAFMHDERQPTLRFGRHYNGKGKYYRMPFMPRGAESLTPFALNGEGPADPSVLADKNSPAAGKVTHPSGAPDNHLLCVYSPGPANHQYTHLPQIDGGIYLLKDGRPAEEPAQLRLIKNDPNYNEQWPRAVVPYERIYGIAEPATPKPLANNGHTSPHLPAGTPYGLVGTSSLYKRESYPNGRVPEGKVTATYAGGKDPYRGLDAFTSHGNQPPLNWHNQGGDVGLYTNDDIFAIRILAMEPTTDRNRGDRSGRLFYSHAMERLRVLGEIPVRKVGPDGKEPLDPDGNPDTSFLARIPADTAFTFQTLDRRGHMLNMAQTWHQLRPGEIRNDCGGCHAHSQAPTPFELTLAAKPDYKVWDLTREHPLVVEKERDASKRRWNAADDAGIASAVAPVSPEYHRDIKPILAAHCTACHSKKSEQPAGNLVLDADDESINIPNEAKVPGTYYRLAADNEAKFGHKPIGWDSWGYPQASRYVRKFQARRSLLVWKVYGQRLDGFTNDDHPSEAAPGEGKTLLLKDQPIDLAKNKHKFDIDFTGSVMPPPEAVDGTYKSPSGETVKAPPLTEDERRTMARWIDLGCPVDLDYDSNNPARAGYGWACDDSRPVIALTLPATGGAPPDRILLGLTDLGSGLDEASLSVTANFPIADAAAGENLAPRFKSLGDGRWELKLDKPLDLKSGSRLTVAVKDRQGNIARLERTLTSP